MKGLKEKTRYRKGDNVELDKKFALCKKVNLFAGQAYHDALTYNESKALIKLWSKARNVPWSLYVQEVSTLVKFYEQIMHCRRSRRRELARIRKEKARRKLRDAAKEGNAKALKKVKSIKKADRVKSAKYLKVKKKLRDQNKERGCRGKRANGENCVPI